MMHFCRRCSCWNTCFLKNFVCLLWKGFIYEKCGSKPSALIVNGYKKYLENYCHRTFTANLILRALCTFDDLHRNIPGDQTQVGETLLGDGGLVEFTSVVECHWTIVGLDVPLVNSDSRRVSDQTLNLGTPWSLFDLALIEDLQYY